MRRRVAISADGVTYRYGHRRELARVVEVPEPPGPEAARRALQGVLAAAEGDLALLRAGWAAVRWEGGDPSAPAWEGPAYLFSFQAPEAGALEVTLVGEDPADWPPPAGAASAE